MKFTSVFFDRPGDNQSQFRGRKTGHRLADAPQGATPKEFPARPSRLQSAHGAQRFFTRRHRLRISSMHGGPNSDCRRLRFVVGDTPAQWSEVANDAPGTQGRSLGELPDDTGPHEELRTAGTIRLAPPLPLRAVHRLRGHGGPFLLHRARRCLAAPEHPLQERESAAMDLDEDRHHRSADHPPGRSGRRDARGSARPRTGEIARQRISPCISGP